MIDNERVYACGYSEGGIFSYELGCRLNNRIAAFSSVSGSMLEDAFRVSYYNLGVCSPIHPTAVLLIPGTSDFSPHSTYSGLQPYYMSANDITTYWANYNNTDPSPNITQVPNSLSKRQKEILEEFNEIESNKPDPVIKSFFEKAKKFWKNS